MKNLLLIVCCSLFGCTHLMHEPDATAESLEAQYYQQQLQRSGGKFTVIPEINQYIEEVGQKVSSRLRNNETYHYTILNNPTPIAWGLPGGHIGMSIGLLHELESEAQLAAVIAHEIGHIEKKHYERTVKIQKRERFMVGLVIFLVSGTVIIPAMNDLVPDDIIQEYEYEADDRAIEILSMTPYSPNALLDALTHFTEQETVSTGLSYTQHTNERIKRLKASHLSKTSPHNKNKVSKNNSQHLSKMKKLYQQWPAYEYYQTVLIAIKAYFDAEKAAEDGDIDDLKYALDTIDNAIQIESRNSLFHEAKGVILAALNNTTDALKSCETAIYLNPNYHGHYIHTGIIHYNAGRRELAKRHFKKSFNLLPTRTAQEYLTKDLPSVFSQ